MDFEDGFAQLWRQAQQRRSLVFAEWLSNTFRRRGTKWFGENKGIGTSSPQTLESSSTAVGSEVLVHPAA